VNPDLASLGFNLSGVLEVIPSSNGPEYLENFINQPNGINNLDLNNDGMIDYVNVIEYQSGYFHLIDTAVDPACELATIVMRNNGNGYADVYIQSNTSYFADSYLVTQLPINVGFCRFVFVRHTLFVSRFSARTLPGNFRTSRVGTVTQKVVTTKKTVVRSVPQEQRRETIYKAQPATAQNVQKPSLINKNGDTQKNFEVNKDKMVPGFGASANNNPAQPKPSLINKNGDTQKNFQVNKDKAVPSFGGNVSTPKPPLPAKPVVASKPLPTNTAPKSTAAVPPKPSGMGLSGAGRKK
jgi:hypothetical protein